MSILHRLKTGLQNHCRQSVASLGDLWRLPMTTLLTVAVLGISLSLPSVLGVIVNNSHQLQQQWTDPTEISLFLKADVSPNRLASLQTRLSGMSEVASFSYQSADQSLQEFQQLSQFSEALNYLDNNPLPAVITVIPSNRHRELEALERLKSKLEGLNEVELARLDLDWLQQLRTMIASLEKMAWGMASLLVLAVILITANTIRMAITQRQDEIRVMKLVGATDAYVRRPFLYAGVWYGLLAALIAAMLASSMLLWFEIALAEVIDSYQTQFTLQGLSGSDLLTLVFTSITLSWLGAWVSVSRHLRAIEPQ
ncbi:permease-like cell division protein FtsX [Ferrimonas aestuarii]|uniref:Cell division protein FtsX n=1 Tax=Ferrimonas aestuarii TaxID=2569539 RepID=A0A4U1BQJ3_9GAMM|nr:permease-like cell division protein FtsX [Ferrimonas aestuarii]TKB55047.1 cell division protein FtsX [Ferrimonas aestuarii]